MCSKCGSSRMIMAGGNRDEMVWFGDMYWCLGRESRCDYSSKSNVLYTLNGKSMHKYPD